MATQHDLADSFQLRSTTGWQTLLAILQSTGERTPKRARGVGDDDTPSSLPGADSEERLAKRIAAVRLNPSS